MTTLLDSFQELNLSNYSPDDVARLNDWAISACTEIERLTKRRNEIDDEAFKYSEQVSELRAKLAALKAQKSVAWAIYYKDDDSLYKITAKKSDVDYCLSMAYWAVPLYAAPVASAEQQGVVLDGSQLAGLLEQVRLDDNEAKPHGSGATYWNNAVIACQVAIRDAIASDPAPSTTEGKGDE